MSFEQWLHPIVEFWTGKNDRYKRQTKKAKSWNAHFAVCPEEMKDIQKRIWTAAQKEAMPT